VKWYWGNYPLAVNIGGFLGSTIQIFGMTYPYTACSSLFAPFLSGRSWPLFCIRPDWDYSQGIRERQGNDEHPGSECPFCFYRCVRLRFAALSGFAGVIAGPLLSTFPGMAQEILIDAFVVIVVGGFGSLGGAVVRHFLIGELQSFGVSSFP